MWVGLASKHFIRRKFQKSTKLLICLENVDPGWAAMNAGCWVKLSNVWKMSKEITYFTDARAQYKIRGKPAK